MNYVTYDTTKQEFVNPGPEPQMTIEKLVGLTKDMVIALNSRLHDLYECMYGEKPTVTTSASTANPTEPYLYKDLELLKDITVDSCEEVKKIFEKLGGWEK